MIDKTAFRKKKRAEIALLPQEYLAASDDAITQRLLTLPEYRNAKRLFAYCSIGREVDTKKLLRSAVEAGKKVYLPVVLGNGIMEFAAFDGFEALENGKFRIPEPKPDAPRGTPAGSDLLLVPGLCFDAKRYRLGQGGGYYDRYLEKTDCITVGLARERLMPVDVPREAHDQAVDILLTESRILRDV